MKDFIMSGSSAICSMLISLECAYHFQTLLAGVVAVIGAVATAIVIWRSAKLPVSAQERTTRELSDQRKRHECLTLSSQFKVLRRRAGQAQASIRTYIAANKDVTERGKERLYLEAPEAVSSWEIMSLLPQDVVQRCLDLSYKLDIHNDHIERSGGTFGSDDFRKRLLRDLDEIMSDASGLANEMQGVVHGG